MVSEAGSDYENELVDHLQDMVLPGGARDGEDVHAAESTDLRIPEIEDKFRPSQEFFDSWPKPSPSFIVKQAQRARIQLFCRVCMRHHPVDTSSYVLCGGCGPAHMPAHRECLANFQGHRPNAQNGGIMMVEPCQEVDFDDFMYTTCLLDSRFLDQDKESLHIDDLWSTWFSVPHDQEGPFPQLQIFPRLQNLIASESRDKPSRQYPSLISFVGDTGSGKSTLIRAIIRMLAPKGQKSYRAPVPGTATDGFDSTSSDVHLFADPGTLFQEAPLMFVDCEGFSGTDTPVARRILSKASRSESSQPLKDGTLRTATSSRSAKDLLAEHANTATHRVDLQWGQINAPISSTAPSLKTAVGHVDADSRKVIVKNLYPRLLYAFSDVVCFVTNNSRAAQTILEEMFNWAKDGHEKTLNQRVRPGLVIVLNKMPQDSQETMSSVERTTRSLLDSFQKSARFGELKKRWESRGREIHSARDLILCYYHSFRVISIPQHTAASPTTAKKISQQIKILYGEIRAMSQRIRERRKSLGMDYDVASLSSYLLQSVTALGNDYNNALDFHRLADGDSALPRRFSEHLLQLMSNMVTLGGLDTTEEIGGESELVKDIIPYIAACIVSQLIPPKDRSAREQMRKQTDFLVDEARRGLQYFRDRYWRCEAKDSSGHRRCKNYSEGHEKGHQFDPSPYPQPRTSDVSNISEDNLEVGVYRSSYDPETYTEQLWQHIAGVDQEQAMEKLAEAATASGVIKITGQRTCLSCLSSTPTNVLPCAAVQHGICEDCIRRYSGSKRHHSIIEINRCPLGCRLLTRPWQIRVKPRTAGARVLVLDGGGIRGIVELFILNEIEKEIGLQIRIQELFDLVIGTSTGGIVALGVFEKRWALSNADQKFQSLACRAFSLRKALKVPLLSKFAEPFLEHKYTSSGINGTLRSAFGGGYLFGQANELGQGGDHVKVGVVSCQEGRRQPCLIANYSRNPIQRGKDGKDGYDWLQREDQQSKDFHTWEAARATSAAQTLFKPYYHHETARTYVDGATVRNNPVRLAYEEQKRIWPSTSSMPPDIIVSVGTGIHVDREGEVRNSRSERLDSFKGMLPSGLRKKVETGLDMVEATLDCHREWVDFKEATHGRLRENCHRLDVGLITKPPSLDAVDKMQDLFWDCRNYLSGPSPPYMDSKYQTLAEHIRAVARRLLASVFYLEHLLPDNMKGDQYLSTIHCRLAPRSEGAISLLALKPEFRLREIDRSDGAKISSIEFVDEVNNFNERTLSAPVHIKVSGGELKRIIEVQYRRRKGPWEPIGGF
ncbi:hypothetical protein B0H67DRAFT_560740 [Lasiosphaeris hirsuta]|uniref:PNPLA domain-containing protein n=1 Tax=Lasiosphaeris hirsuta TaxID=260670 RepID=A0AA40B9I6_9PEZI|nr:hypothetical protein B0H67DRAFT_560740 [Lasiosphaeris hirsuta]